VRSSESIVFNIVEGCGSTSRREFARFLDISVKSTCELEYQLQLAMDYRVVTKRDWQVLSAETVEIRRMLCGLRRKVLEADRAATDVLRAD
jgi:four helix bundle protein